MFRSASLREIQALLAAFDRSPPPGTSGLSEADQKKIVGDEVCQAMLESGCKHIHTALCNAKMRKEVTLVTGLCLDDCSCLKSAHKSCVVCLSQCTNIAEGALTVLERDLMQLMHGEHAAMFQKRGGVEFLLSGIALGQLYSSLPETSGFNALILSVLCMMMQVSTWSAALELYGPAHRVHRKTKKGFGRVESETTLEIPMALLAMASRVAPKGTVAHCDCGRIWSDGKIVHCPCGSVLIRYKQYENDEEERVADFRSRAMTF